MKKNLFLLLLVVFSGMALGQEHTLTLKIEGKEYDSLYLRLHAPPDHHFYHGREIEKGKWVFTYPDSIYQKAIWFFISSLKDSTVHNFVFKATEMEKENAPCVGCFFDKNTTVVLSYDSLQSSSPQEKEIIRPFSAREYIKVTSYEDYFHVLNLSENNELEAGMHRMYCGFPHFLRQEYSYEESVDNYEKVVRNYPDSEGLMALLDLSFSRFRSNEDGWRVYSSFTDKARNS